MSRWKHSLIVAAVATTAVTGFIALRQPGEITVEAAALKQPELHLPLKDNSVRFAAIGDNGTGDPPQYEVAEQMNRMHELTKFSFVIMLGDNIYGGKKAADFKRKFEVPYTNLLDAGVKFYASLGNHDKPDESFYKPFNMDGQRYYKYRRENVEFFALDSSYMNAPQLAWIDKALAESTADWKICYFHHPLYSNARYHGADVDVRSQLEPIFIRRGVNVVFTGHEHVYERFYPQKGIYYFLIGNSGELRAGNLKPAAMMAKGFDTDRSFGVFEISGDELFFQQISRLGDTVDQGVLTRQAPAK